MNKDLDYYMALPYRIVLKPHDGDWYALIPALRGCMADDKTQAEALKEIEIVKHLWLEGNPDPRT